jgi:hypothetical protein
MNMIDLGSTGMSGGMVMTGFARFAACGLMAATLIVAGTTFVRAADDDDDVSFDKKLQNNVMSAIGLRGGPDIDYKERSPLVLPPKIDLPPPQNNAAASTPNWPVDADQKRKKEEVGRRRDEVEESRPLRPNELNVGARTRSRTAGPTQDQADGKPSRPEDLGYTGGILGSLWGSKKDEAAQFKSEPARTSLIEPPAGYQTPSPSQPYQFKYEKWTPKIPSFFDFGTETK